MNEHIAKPNYPAYILLAITFIPFAMLEIDPDKYMQSSAFEGLLDNFGFILLFQWVLYGFVLAKSIKEYDLIPVTHRVVMMVFNTVYGFILVTFFIAWLGYFNAGLQTFIWLNE